MSVAQRCDHLLNNAYGIQPGFLRGFDFQLEKELDVHVIILLSRYLQFVS